MKYNQLCQYIPQVPNHVTCNDLELCSFVQALDLDAGQETYQFVKRVRAESEKRRLADEDTSRLYDELKKKTKELESVKIKHAADQDMLRKVANDTVEKYKNLDKKF